MNRIVLGFYCHWSVEEQRPCLFVHWVPQLDSKAQKVMINLFRDSTGKGVWEIAYAHSLNEKWYISFERHCIHIFGSMFVGYGFKNQYLPEAKAEAKYHHDRTRMTFWCEEQMFLQFKMLGFRWLLDVINSRTPNILQQQIQFYSTSFGW